MVHDGTGFIKLNPTDASTKLTVDERGGTIWDGIALAIIVHPETVKNLWFDLIGSRVYAENVPELDWWYNGPRLNYYYYSVGVPSPGRPLVCGRNIAT